LDNDDAALIERCRAGDLTAFEPLVQKYRQRVYRLAYNVLRDPEEAWDVSQDAFIRAYQALSSFRGESAFYTWLFRIVMNVARDRARQHAARGRAFGTERVAEEDWDAVLATNLKGAFLMTKYAARGMIKRRWGRVINITSVVGLNGNKGQSNYSASKAGIIGFTKSVAKELASRNVLVNAVAPGFVETELTQGISPEAKKYFLDNIPLGRLGQGSDIASAVLFLASDFASYITGQVLVVDGGMVM